MAESRWKQHPDYAEGFYDAIDGEPLFDDASEAYKDGWHGAQRARAILKDNGFSETAPGDFSFTTAIKAD